MTDTVPVVADIVTQLGLVPDQVVHFIDNDLSKVPCRFKGIKGDRFVVTFDGDSKKEELVHSTRLAFDSSPIFVRPKVVKQAVEPKAKAAPIKVVCQFSVDDFIEAFPKAKVYSRSGAAFDHEEYDVLSHIVIFDDNTKASFNSYNMIIFSKLSADEYDKLKGGTWTKATSAIDDMAKLTKKLTDGKYVKHAKSESR